MRRLIVTACIFLAIAIGLTVGAGELSNTIWHNAVLYLGGVFTGGTGMITALILAKQSVIRNE